MCDQAGQIATNGTEELLSSSKKRGYLYKCLCDNTLSTFTLPYLSIFPDIISLSNTCKKVHSFIFSRSCNVWSERAVDVCLDPSCFGCGRYAIPMKIAFSLFSRCSITTARLHIPASILNTCLLSFNSESQGRLICGKGDKAIESFLEAQPSLQKLHMRLRLDCRLTSVDFGDSRRKDTISTSEAGSKSSSSFSSSSSSSSSSISPVLRASSAFDLLSELTLCGFSCSMWVDHILILAGRSLRSLSFIESSPLGLFKSLSSRCPLLENLSVEGVQSTAELLDYESEQLIYLRLYNTGIRLRGKLRLPKLLSLECLDEVNEGNNRYSGGSAREVKDVVLAIPRRVKSVELRIDSRHANACLTAISRRFPELESLVLHLPDSQEPPDDITVQTMAALVAGCTRLTNVEFLDGLVGFTTQSFELFGSMPRLQRLKVYYDDPAVSGLPALLEQSQSLEEITFLESASYVCNEDVAVWSEMEERLRLIAEPYPGIIVSLKDWWWGVQ